MKLLLLTSEQNLCEMALVKNAARNGAVCYHHDSKKFLYFFVFFFPKAPRSIKIVSRDCSGEILETSFHREKTKIKHKIDALDR